MGKIMTVGKTLAPHETFELHELLTFKNVCATKSATMASLVKDEELKSILQEDVTVSQSQIRELQDLIQDSNWKNDSSWKMENLEDTSML